MSGAGPRLVHSDPFAEIWELPLAAPVFTAVTGERTRVSVTVSTSPGCTVAGHGFDSATVDCNHPATLLRRVQYMPGWTATADGAPTSVHPVDGGAFQSVRVPAGRTTVHFAYLPPRATAAVVVAVVALVVLVGSWMTSADGQTRRRRRDGRPAADNARDDT